MERSGDETCKTIKFGNISQINGKNSKEAPQKTLPTNLFSSLNIDCQYTDARLTQKLQCLTLLEQFCFTKKSSDTKALSRWRRVIKLINMLSHDPWQSFPITRLAAEKAYRHRYSAIKKRWVTDEVVVKIETLPFDHGAMRECFRMKKLPCIPLSDYDWSHSTNYVAKQYINRDTSKDVYFEDVRLQMDAKLWAEEYNRYNPPKKVDVFQLSVLELYERPGQPLFHIEHFMDGEYRKYNSNSGFVDETYRSTPHAFSHFTFEHSGHRLLITDIQGVDDLYTDPQIHTSDSIGYGDGNLGTRGMALFFHSHRCNSICQYLGLQSFDLTSSETEVCNSASLDSSSNQAGRCKYLEALMKGTEVRALSCCGDDCTQCTYAANQSRRSRVTSVDSLDSNGYDCGEITSFQWIRTSSGSSSGYYTYCHEFGSPSVISQSPEPSSRFTPDCEQDHQWTGLSNELPQHLLSMVGRRFRTASESSDMDCFEDARKLHFNCHDHHKSTSLMALGNMDSEVGQSTLGQVHFELAQLHRCGRFLNEKVLEGPLVNHVNWDAIVFHVQSAASLGCPDALLTLAMYHLKEVSSQDVFDEIYQPFLMMRDTLVTPSDDVHNLLEYVQQAMSANNDTAILLYSELMDGTIPRKPPFDIFSNDEDSPLPAISLAAAVDGYKKLQHQLDESHPKRLDIVLRMARLYQTGGHDLEKNFNEAGELYNMAAERAMAAMDGRAASKYFTLAEECLSMCSDNV